MEIIIKGEPKEIAALEQALKDGKPNFVPKNSDGICFDAHAKGCAPTDFPESISTALRKATRKLAFQSCK